MLETEHIITIVFIVGFYLGFRFRNWLERRRILQEFNDA